MEAKNVLPIDPNATHGSWPRILGLLAIMTLCYCATSMSRFIPTAVRIYKDFPGASWMPNTATEYWYWAITLQELLVVAGALIPGAVLLRSGNYKLLICGSWTLLMLALVYQLSLWFIYPNHRFDLVFFSSAFDILPLYIFPALIIAVLRAHRLRFVHADAGEEHPSPWPRLGRVVGILSILFGVISTGNAVSVLHEWTFLSLLGMHDTIQRLQIAVASANLIIGALMIATGLRLRIYNRSHRLVVIAVESWLVVCVVGLVTSGYFFVLQSRSPGVNISNSVFRALTIAVFPLTILILLRDYSKSIAQPSNSAPFASAIPPPGHTPPPRSLSPPAIVLDTAAPH